jgi:hypothetical protein
MFEVTAPVRRPLFELSALKKSSFHVPLTYDQRECAQAMAKKIAIYEKWSETGLNEYV